jgi:Peptidase family C50
VFQLLHQFGQRCWFLPESNTLEALARLRQRAEASSSDWLSGTALGFGDRWEDFSGATILKRAAEIDTTALWRCAGLLEETLFGPIQDALAQTVAAESPSMTSICAVPWLEQRDIAARLLAARASSTSDDSASFTTHAGLVARNLRLVVEGERQRKVKSRPLAHTVIRVTCDLDQQRLVVTRREPSGMECVADCRVDDGALLELLEKFREILRASSRGPDELDATQLRRTASSGPTRPTRLSRTRTDPTADKSSSRREIFWEHRRALDRSMDQVAVDLERLVGPLGSALLLGRLLPRQEASDGDDKLSLGAICTALCGDRCDGSHQFDANGSSALIARCAWDAYPAFSRKTQRVELLQGVVPPQTSGEDLDRVVERWDELCCERFGTVSTSEAAQFVLNEIVGQGSNSNRTWPTRPGTWNRETVHWCLDDILQELPCESMPSHRGWPSTRLLDDSAVAGPCPSLKNATVLLNPTSDPDLSDTELRLRPVLSSLGWTDDDDSFVVTGDDLAQRSAPQQPFAAELSDHGTDVFVFCGHDFGQQVGLGTEAILSMERVPALVLLFGCSSGALRGPRGIFGPAGIAQVWLARGARAVVGNLWDVTSQELDKFSNELLRLYFQNSTPLTEAVELARRKCRLPNMTGAAPVIYGSPLAAIQPMCNSLDTVVDSE